MADATATKNPSDLHDVLGRIEQIFFSADTNKAPSALTGSFDVKFPVLDESVTLNMGEPDVTRIKLIDQNNWTSYAKKGDPDISFQVPSVSAGVGDILGNKIGTGAASTTLGTTFQGYASTPKKVIGSLLYMSNDRVTCIYFPNVEIYATFIAGEGDNPAYFNCAVTPIPDTSGADYYIGTKTPATGA